MWLKEEVRYHIRTVHVADGQLWHKHIDQLKNTSDIDNHAYESSPAEAPTSESELIDTSNAHESEGTQELPSDRYHKRNHKAPDRLTY